MPPPNILFLFSDQHNARILGCDGDLQAQTPNLDRLASQGIRFSRTYCQNGICLPSRTSLLTGRYCRNLGTMDNDPAAPVPEGIVPLQKLLKDNGYRTAAFGKRHLAHAIDYGWDYSATTMPEGHDKSDETYWDWVGEQGACDAFLEDWYAEHGDKFGRQSSRLMARESSLSPAHTMEAYTAMRTREFLRESENNRSPFFCWCSFYRPHQPYTPLRKYLDRFDPRLLKLPDNLYEPVENLPPKLREWRTGGGLAEAAVNQWYYRMILWYYYALVAEIDDHVGAVLRELDKQGFSENTIVIYASDHGDFAGEHGMVEKCAAGHNVYESTLRVPLLIRWPGTVRPGSVNDDLVELLDLYPTLAEAAGIRDTDIAELPGRSLVETVRSGRPTGRDCAFSENWSQVTAIGKRWKLGTWIEAPRKEWDYREFNDQLFDRERDPSEVHNGIAEPANTGIVRQIRDTISHWAENTPGRAKQEMAARAGE